MPVPRTFKTDESFLEKLAIGAVGTQRVFEDLARQGHAPLELERGSLGFKIWKTIKIKRVRVPDILCLRCARRWESRAKTRMSITMSHSMSDPERGWDFGLNDDDFVALVQCKRIGPGPLDWHASPVVQYVRVSDMRQAWQANQVRVSRPKGAEEGFEIQVNWPAAVASVHGIVEQVGTASIRYRPINQTRPLSVRLVRQSTSLIALVKPGDEVLPGQIIAAIVPVTATSGCSGSADIGTYIALLSSTSLSDRYTAVKALGQFIDPASTEALLARLQDAREHIYVRLDAAAGLIRRDSSAGLLFVKDVLRDNYLQNRLEAVIILGEVATAEAVQLLINTLEDPDQHPEIRAGAAWALGECGATSALPVLLDSFNALDVAIRIEAARALAKLARVTVDDVLQALQASTPVQRPGIAWALSKAGSFAVRQLFPALTDDDARHWVAYIIGTQDPERMLSDIEALAARDPEVYFAASMLWKIISSWVYQLEEY